MRDVIEPFKQDQGLWLKFIRLLQRSLSSAAVSRGPPAAGQTAAVSRFPSFVRPPRAASVAESSFSVCPTLNVRTRPSPVIKSSRRR